MIEMDWKQRIRTVLRWVRRWAIRGTIALLVLIILVFALLQTPYSKAAISSLLSTQLSEALGMEVEAGQLSGTIPLYCSWDEITIGDDVSRWLKLTHVTIEISPWTVIAGRLRIPSIHINTLALDRVPLLAKEDTTSAERTRPRLPQNLPPLTIGEISVDEIRLPTDIIKTDTPLAFTGNVRMGSSPRPLEAQISLRYAAGQTEWLRLSARIEGEPPALSLEARAQDTEQGILPILTNLKKSGDIHFSLDGHGTLSDWRGEMAVSAEQYGSVETTLRLGLADTLQLGAAGSMRPNRTLPPEPYSVLVGDSNRFQFDASLTDQGCVVIDSLSLETSVAGATGTATYRLDDSWLECEIVLAAPNLAALQPVAPVPLAGAASLVFSATGPISQPTAMLAVKLHHPIIANCTASFLEARVNAVCLDRRQEPIPSIRFSGQATAADIHISNPSGEVLFAEPSIVLTMQAHALAGQPVEIDKFQCLGTDWNIQSNGTVDPSIPSVTMALLATIDNLARVPLSANQKIKGQFQLRTNLNADFHSETGSAVITGKGNAQTPHPMISALSGNTQTIEGSVRWTGYDRFQLEKLRFAGEMSSFVADASVDIASQTLDARWNAAIPDLKPLASIARHPVAGSFSMNGQASGSWQDLSARADIDLAEFIWNEISLDSIRISLDAKNLFHSPTGRIESVLTKADRRVHLVSDGSLASNEFKLSTLKLSSPNLVVEGAAAIHLSNYLIDGAFKAESNDLAALGSMFNQPLRGRLWLEASLASTGQEQRLAADLAIDKLQSSFASVDEISFRADIADLYRNPKGTATLIGSAVSLGDLSIDSLHLDASGRSEVVEWTIDGKGSWNRPVGFVSTGKLTLAEHKQLQVSIQDGFFGDIPLNATLDAMWNPRLTDYELKRLAISIGSGQIDAAGLWNPRLVSFNVFADRIPLEYIGVLYPSALNATGVLQADLSLQGAPDNPRLSAAVHGKHVRILYPQWASMGEGSIEILASYIDRQFAIESRVEQWFPSPLLAYVKIPAPLDSLYERSFHSLLAQPIEGRVEGVLDLNSVSALVPVDGQKMSGALDVDIDVAGTLNDPSFKGRLLLNNGSYDHLEYGVSLRNVEAAISADERTVTIDRFQMNDMAQGRVSLSGRIETVPNPNGSIRIDFTNAKLLRREDVVATVNGQLSLSGSLETLSMVGSLELDPVEVNLAEPLPAEIKDIEIVGIHVDRPSESASGRTTPAKSLIDPTLSITVSIPGRLFVRGRGIDSVWKGSIHITGTALKPFLKGTISVVRGHMNFFANRMDLSGGSVVLNGSDPKNAILNLTAETVKKNTSFYLRVIGPVGSPQLVLDSNPPYPADEVLSRLLFGRRLTDITPFQALRLAQAANALRGKQSVFDPIGETRGLLGLDQLEFRQNEEEDQEEAMVGIGKYLTEDIYVDFEKGLGKESGKISVEIQLTPTIYLDSELGLDKNSGIGVFWKYDY